ncbi:MAG: ABC transporter permease [Cyclobacteriaceae bacterium]
MGNLTDQHIDYIIKDLNYRGIIVEGFQDEVVDHICSAVEIEIGKGKRFIDAYHEVLKSFGSTSGLRKTQFQTLKSKNQNSRIMIRNYLTIAWRNLKRHAFYSFINIAGLAIGVAACIIIVLFVLEELNYDTFNTRAERIYRVHNEVKYGTNHFHMNGCSAPTAQMLAENFPEIESTVRFIQFGTYLVKPEDTVENIKEENVAWTDSTIFKIFSLNIIEGDDKTALTQPASVAISRRTAKKYFPFTSALGKSLILDNKYHFTVTAVYEDIPQASHFHFDILMSLVGDLPPAKLAQRTTLFDSYNFRTYLLLKPGAEAKALEAKLPGFIEKYRGKQSENGTFSMEKFRASGNKYEMSLMPLRDIHLHSDLDGEFESNGSITYVYLFSTIAAFILLIACINFMNLSTARSANRAKEVGVRKVMGSLRSHLMRQFLTESTLVTSVAFIFALGLAYLLLPFFNILSQKQLQLPFNDPAFYLALLGAGLLVGLLAGVYPSFYLSAFRPVNVLKGHLSVSIKSGFIRGALVVFQFVISIFLIVGAITVNRQLSYMQNKKLGYEKEQVIIVHDAYALRPNKVQTFKNEALRIDLIESSSISSYVPVQIQNAGRGDRTFWKTGNEPTTENLLNIQLWSVDHDYFNTFKMKFKMGRGFSEEFPSDGSAVVLNEAAVSQFGLSGDPIGQSISANSGAETKSWTIIGVVENFHFATMRENIAPLGIFLGNTDGFVSFRFRTDNPQEVIHAVEKVWKSLAPGQPFQYSFLDVDFGKMYWSEERLGKLFTVFATLAIAIACLGLFALTAFTAEQRSKEIGIRKVLGASVDSIVLLLSRDFGKLIIIAFIISGPLAWYAVNWWLKMYTYKAVIGVAVYFLAGALALIIALFTISFHSIKAASANPVTSLRNE